MKIMSTESDHDSSYGHGTILTTTVDWANIRPQFALPTNRLWNGGSGGVEVRAASIESVRLTTSVSNCRYRLTVPILTRKLLSVTESCLLPSSSSSRTTTASLLLRERSAKKRGGTHFWVMTLMMMVVAQGAGVKRCSTVLYRNQCDLKTCGEQCYKKYFGNPVCASAGFGPASCVCVYNCPWH